MAAKRAQLATAKTGAAKAMHDGAFAKLLAAFDAALDDDLNTAGALDALMRMDRKDPAVVAALKAHRDPKAQEAVAPKPAK